MNPILQRLQRALDDHNIADADHYHKMVTAMLERGGDDFSDHDINLIGELFARYETLPPAAANHRGHHHANHDQEHQGGAILNTTGAEPSLLGAQFHNVYTQLSFPAEAPIRTPPTPLTIDEKEEEKDRFTGVLDLEVTLLSPLLTSNPLPTREERGHRTFSALRIGDDIIVPGTSVRGALRSLMSIITGGTLGHIDEQAWLCQSRDANLGPPSQQNPNQPQNVFLGEVVKPSRHGKPGIIRLGRTKLVKLDTLNSLAARAGLNLARPRAGEPIQTLWIDEHQTGLSNTRSDKYAWKLKLSGRPIDPHGKREGMFLPDLANEIPVRARLWQDYTGRYRHSEHPELRRGDLIWLEPKDPQASAINTEQDIASLQWARWGRHGERLIDIIATRHPNQLPDSINPDGLVDEVTNLFGQVQQPELMREVAAYLNLEDAASPAPSFAGRIRAGNLVFRDANRKLQTVTLAPLAPPHPGCAAFYRDPETGTLGEAADILTNRSLKLRGFKVYRTTQERGDQAPWHYKTQGIYDDTGALRHPGRVNKTAQLLPETSTAPGRLRLSLRALTNRELALLLAACSVDWRLGGGKPLGLGHCRISKLTLRRFHDDGRLEDVLCVDRKEDTIPDLVEPYNQEWLKTPHLAARLRAWQASQTSVNCLRYPRAVSQNRNKKNRGGHVWFSRHAQPKKGTDEAINGLQVMHVSGDLQRRANKTHIRAQPLPAFNPEQPQADVLFGYDLYIGEGADWTDKADNRQTHIKRIEPFDPATHARRDDRSGGNQGGNRDRRRGDRGGR
jgi:hypothetical protein